MKHFRNTAVAIGAVLVVCVGVLTVWYAWTSRDQSGANESEPGVIESDNRTGGYAIYLMPVAIETVTDRQNGEELWDGMLAGIAADTDSQKLFSRLYGGVPVKFLTDPERHDELAESPNSEFPVVVSVKATRHVDTISKHKGHVYGVLDVIRKSKLRFRPHVSDKSVDAALASAMDSAFDSNPDDVSILLLVVNDYLLRTHPGWQLFGHGFSADEIELPTGGPDELRSDLDQKIEDFVKLHTGHGVAKDSRNR